MFSTSYHQSCSHYFAAAVQSMGIIIAAWIVEQSIKKLPVPRVVQSLRKQLNRKSLMLKLYIIITVLLQCDLFNS